MQKHKIWYEIECETESHVSESLHSSIRELVKTMLSLVQTLPSGKEKLKVTVTETIIDKQGKKILDKKVVDEVR